MLHGDPSRHQHQAELLLIVFDDFVDWLGVSKYKWGLTTIPPSRFSHSNSNGLWDYSPFLCGVGLMEALDLTYSMNLFMWDRIPEPMCLIHLHNMLVRKKYIGKEVGLYGTLQQFFRTQFFTDGKAPSSDFEEAFAAAISMTDSRRGIFQRRTMNQTAPRMPTDIHGMLDEDMNQIFKQKSFLKLYRRAHWLPERIPDEEIPAYSSLAILRISRTKHEIDPATGKPVFENTALVSRVRSEGMDDETIMRITSLLQHQPIPQEVIDSFPVPEGFTLDTSALRDGGTAGRRNASTSYRELLEILKLDLMDEISGRRPVCSQNYTYTTARMMALFTQIEDELKRRRNPLWVRAYEQDSALTREKRASLAFLALTGSDDDDAVDECLKVMATEFQNARVGFMNYIYWEDLDDRPVDKSAKPDPTEDDEFDGAASCTVM